MFVEPATVAAFALVAGAIVLSPGPDTLLILRWAMTSGRAAGFAAVAGVQLGLVVHTTLAALGISALIASSPRLFQAMAVAGAGYLAWLGVQALRDGAIPAPGGGEGGRYGGGGRRAWRDAALCNILNPKVIVLFVALYPNFLTPGRGEITAQIATLSLVLVLLNVVWQVSLVLGAQLAGRWLARPPVRRGVSRVTGGIFLAFAVAMLWQHLG